MDTGFLLTGQRTRLVPSRPTPMRRATLDRDLSSPCHSQVLIGGWGNTESAIFRQAGVLQLPDVIKATPGILQCVTYRHFWVSWETDRLVVGQGMVVGVEPFMEWAPASPRAVGSSALRVINAIGLSTGSNTPGLWQFGDLTGRWRHHH